jgi:hypothetical protein
LKSFQGSVAENVRHAKNCATMRFDQGRIFRQTE